MAIPQRHPNIQCVVIDYRISLKVPYVLQVDDLVHAVEGELRPQAAALAQRLRRAGRAVDLVLEPRKMKWVFKVHSLAAQWVLFCILTGHKTRGCLDFEAALVPCIDSLCNMTSGTKTTNGLQGQNCCPEGGTRPLTQGVSSVERGLYIMCPDRMLCVPLPSVYMQHEASAAIMEFIQARG